MTAVTAAHCRLSEERDLPLLRYLWKWKLATTAALSAKFFGGRSPITAHKRLWQLESARFIKAESISRDGKSFVWQLQKDGFAAIRDSLPALKEEGFRAEYPSHDLLVSAFHQGDFFFDTPEGNVLFSEQQLRRYETEFYPKGIPKTEIHRPDGYTVNRSGNVTKVVAIEVELTPKRRSDYELTFDFYTREKVDDVLWLLPREAMAKRLQHLCEMQQVAGDHCHSFVSYPAFRSQGWNATIHGGKRAGIRIGEVLGNKAETNANIVSQKFLLDTRKAPHRSKTSRKFNLAEIID